jgi:hypothetical protein
VDLIPVENVNKFNIALNKTMINFSKECPYRKFSKPGIYKLINNRNNMVYIGMSVDMYKRIKQHMKDAFHYKYTSEAGASKRFSLVSIAIANNNFDFSYEILEIIPRNGLNFDDKVFRKTLKEREKYYIEKYKSYDRDLGYNIVK